MAIPLFMTFGLPPLGPALMFAQAWTSPVSFPYAAGFPILSLLLAYVYFPVATATRKFFDKQNKLKSVLLGLAGFEIYRQLLIFVFEPGKSGRVLIQQHCGSFVETLPTAIACGAASTVALIGINLLLWLVPAALLFSISRRRQPSPLVRSEA
jgi:hypothetical protein